MKTIFTAAVIATMAITTTVQAGNLVYVPEQAPMMEEEAPMGSSGAWILPLIGIGLICLIVCNQGGDEPENGNNGNGFENGNNGQVPT